MQDHCRRLGIPEMERLTLTAGNPAEGSSAAPLRTAVMTVAALREAQAREILFNQQAEAAGQPANWALYFALGASATVLATCAVVVTAPVVIAGAIATAETVATVGAAVAAGVSNAASVAGAMAAPYVSSAATVIAPYVSAGIAVLEQAMLADATWLASLEALRKFLEEAEPKAREKAERERSFKSN